ncbi:PaaI family thioesterase [Polycyclovorans algicola]|uniref:PaaI family thioesterase n=1 Tax=Polycyclovorans algicola TaxID=616992 RepID=UPI000694E303|nr:PaaI family thioesterase [Polycyclovorans algicola]
MNPLHNVNAETGQAYFVDVVPHSCELGLRYVESAPGRLQLSLPWREDLVGDPDTGVIHGGAITTLFDATFGGALLSELSELRRIATLDLRIDYLRAAQSGATVFCDARVDRLTKHIAFIRAVAHDGDPEDLIAIGVASFVVFQDQVSGHAREGDPTTWKVHRVAD